MYKHILIPTDGSELSEKAVGHGVGLAKALGARVTAVTVSAPYLFAPPRMVMYTPEAYRTHVATLAANYLNVVNDAATKAGVPCDVVHVEHEHPYAAIIDTVKARTCDAIVMASHGRRGISAIVLGSETVKGAYP